MTNPKRSRIQEKNRATIFEAALDVFSANGYRGATLDQIAKSANLSKPNILYYFPSKEAIFEALLGEVLDIWLEPLTQLTDADDPVEALLAYVHRKLEMSRSMPRESRLFANEIVQGAPRLVDRIEGPLKAQVDEKAALIQGWADAGKIAPVDPYHLIFSIWATTQHYADFDAQIRGILAPTSDEHLNDAANFLEQLYRRMLTVS